MHQENIRDMYTAVEDGRGFDVIIVVSSNKDQAKFWQKRLEATKGSVIGRGAEVISVEEDWLGGAGQLLGTLYAWNKAETAQRLMRILESGRNIAMYHTAGKGTRMAPLPAAEANNKSAIKLPRMIYVSGKKTPMTVLEAVIFQTGIFAATRQGRLCVFWGDQVFIPSKLVDCARSHHAEIMDIRSVIPSDEETWRRDWQSYGLIIPTSDGQALQREKQSWSELNALIDQNVARPNEHGKVILGKSLGSFTVSSAFLSSLLEEFSFELSRKQGKMDTDPDLWMPLTTSREDFVDRGGDEFHWDRIDEFKQRFLSQNKQGLKLFGDKDIGSDTLWWDYGQVRLYHHNFLKALEESAEGDCLRKFYNLDKHWVQKSSEDGLAVENSILVNVQAKGKIRDCVLMDVSADKIDISNSVIVDSSLSQMRGKQALLYNCIDIEGLKLSPETVVADVFMPSQGRIRMKTELVRDGKEDWDNVIPGNPYSFSALSRTVSNQLAAGFVAERDRW
ncbi:MAG: hypothetical protein GY845_06845, partial [Planctomycetes bacterium]|nr:hypothetical protein [Planctomycetota bacterium]